MRFIIRNAENRDVEDLIALASQFALLNLPPDREMISEKIERSLRAFTDPKTPREAAEYLFVVEDLERDKVVGSSLILAKHGTQKSPHSYFEVRKEERFSRDLGIGFIHQVIRLRQDTNGPTEIGGLLVDRAYRRMPEKLGKQVSLIRFLFMGMERKRFEERILCEFAPPLTREGRSEFWEALGRRFTGLPYQEADAISQRHKEFISSLFPDGDIYLGLLDPRARQVLGQVNESTKPAQHLLENLGFRYLNHVDPFDGGPHYDVATGDVKLVRDTKSYTFGPKSQSSFEKSYLVATFAEGVFRGCLVRASIDPGGTAMSIPEPMSSAMKLKLGQTIFATLVGE
jgi:arginine N-succinyltransferase